MRVHRYRFFYDRASWVVEVMPDTPRDSWPKREGLSEEDLVSTADRHISVYAGEDPLAAVIYEALYIYDHTGDYDLASILSQISRLFIKSMEAAQ